MIKHATKTQVLDHCTVEFSENVVAVKTLIDT
jgi:hypothetical protein